MDVQTLNINNELLEKVAQVARLKLSQKEKDAFIPQFREILGAFQKLSKANVDNEKPCFHPVPLRDAYREDDAGSCLSQEEALRNAHDTKDGYFKGPKVV